MNWLNISIEMMRSSEYLGAEPVERATWLNLMAWCAGQENGGIIEGAADWTDRKWQQVCGVTKEEATLVSELYGLETNSGSLVVHFYPSDKEQEVKAKRDTARVNGKKGGRPKKTEPKTDQEPKPDNKKEPSLVNSEKAERKGKERKGIGKEDISCPATPPKSPPSAEVLDFIWESVPQISRTRSSQVKLEREWKRIKAAERPSLEELELAMEAWNGCLKWTEGFSEGVHLWVRNRQWRNLPTALPDKKPKADIGGRTMSITKLENKTNESEGITT